MIKKMISPLIKRAVPPLVGGNGFFYGVPLVTNDGFALFDINDQVLLASGVTALSYTRPSQPLVTSDGFALIDSANQLLLGA